MQQNLEPICLKDGKERVAQPHREWESMRSAVQGSAGCQIRAVEVPEGINHQEADHQ